MASVILTVLTSPVFRFFTALCGYGSALNMMAFTKITKKFYKVNYKIVKQFLHLSAKIFQKK